MSIWRFKLVYSTLKYFVTSSINIFTRIRYPWSLQKWYYTFRKCQTFRFWHLLRYILRPSCCYQKIKLFEFSLKLFRLCLYGATWTKNLSSLRFISRSAQLYMFCRISHMKKPRKNHKKATDRVLFLVQSGTASVFPVNFRKYFTTPLSPFPNDRFCISYILKVWNWIIIYRFIKA